MNSNKTHRSRVAGAILCRLTGFLMACQWTAFSAVTLASASNTLFAIDPAAHKILNQMQSKYSSLNALSEEIDAQESPSLPYSLAVHTHLRVLRPGFLSVVSDSKSSRTGSSQVIADGSFCYVAAPQYPARYLKFPVAASPDALQTALTEGITSGFTLALFSDPEFIARTFADSRLATLTVEKPIKVDGQLADVVVSSDTNGATLTLYIGHRDHLLRKVIAIDPTKAGNFTEAYSYVEANPPLKSSDFVFVAPLHSAPYYASSFNAAQSVAPYQ
jgi:hypothetical protein